MTQAPRLALSPAVRAQRPTAMWRMWVTNWVTIGPYVVACARTPVDTSVRLTCADGWQRCIHLAFGTKRSQVQILSPRQIWAIPVRGERGQGSVAFCLWGVTPQTPTVLASPDPALGTLALNQQTVQGGLVVPRQPWVIHARGERGLGSVVSWLLGAKTLVVLC